MIGDTRPLHPGCSFVATTEIASYRGEDIAATEVQENCLEYFRTEKNTREISAGTVIAQVKKADLARLYFFHSAYYRRCVIYGSCILLLVYGIKGRIVTVEPWVVVLDVVDD